MQHNKDERDEASRLKKCIERLEFVFLLVVMTKILGEINVASQYLQNKDADLQRAADHLYSADKNLFELRSKFDTMKEEAVHGEWHLHLSRNGSPNANAISMSWPKILDSLTLRTVSG